MGGASGSAGRLTGQAGRLFKPAGAPAKPEPHSPTAILDTCAQCASGIWVAAGLAGVRAAHDCQTAGDPRAPDAALIQSEPLKGTQASWATKPPTGLIRSYARVSIPDLDHPGQVKLVGSVVARNGPDQCYEC